MNGVFHYPITCANRRMAEKWEVCLNKKDIDPYNVTQAPMWLGTQFRRYLILLACTQKSLNICSGFFIGFVSTPLYSVRKLFTGFDKAALMAWYETVSKAIPTAEKPANPK